MDDSTLFALMNWDTLKKKVETIQAIAVTIAALLGGAWAVFHFRAEGLDISGCNIVIDAKQLGEQNGERLLGVQVAVTGSDRRGYHYDFRKAYLSVLRVRRTDDGHLVQDAVARRAPEDALVHAAGQPAVSVSENSHISSYRTLSFSFVFPLKEAGIYILSFAMPSDGVVAASVPSNNLKVDASNPRELGVFSGELKTTIVEVR